MSLGSVLSTQKVSYRQGQWGGGCGISFRSFKLSPNSLLSTDFDAREVLGGFTFCMFVCLCFLWCVYVCNVCWNEVVYLYIGVLEVRLNRQRLYVGKELWSLREAWGNWQWILVGLDGFRICCRPRRLRWAATQQKVRESWKEWTDGWCRRVGRNVIF